MKKVIPTILAVLVLILATAGISYEIYASNIPKTSIEQITALKESFSVEVTEADNVNGYQIEYSTSSDFTDDNTKKINTESQSLAVKNLQGGSAYYVRVRTYKSAGSAVLYSLWSNVTSVTPESKIALNNLTVTPTTATVIIGKTLQLSTTLEPENTDYSNLLYSTSDSNIATVTSDGLVTGVKEGKVEITVRATETDKKVTVSITVEKPYVAQTGIKITNKSGSIVETGDTLKMVAQILPADATDQKVIWKVDDETKATIADDGTLTALRPTEYVLVTASTKDGKYTAQCKLEISKNSGFLTTAQLDKLDLSGVNNLMIVAHPDDETFWGCGHILNGKYFIVVLSNGWHSDRVSDFNNVMKRYGDDKGLILSYPDTRRYLYTASGKYNGYETDYWSTCMTGMEEDIKLLLNYKKWDTVVTHNPDGEYNKYHHQQVSNLVTKCIANSKNSSTDLYYFGHYYGASATITGDRISDSDLAQKNEIIKMYLPTAQGAYEAFGHMLPYENWILKQDWQ